MTRRELMKWGIFTATGALALKNGLSPFAPSAYADDIPTGTPRSPLFGAQPFTQRMPRLTVIDPVPLGDVTVDGEKMAMWPDELGERPSKRLSYHTEFTSSGGSQFVNPWTGRGPIEGRAPGEMFAHQRWDEYFPRVGYRLSIGQIAPDTRFHPDMAPQDPNSIWTFGVGGLGAQGHLPPVLVRARYGESMVARVYNSTPVDREDNNGFGRNEFATHFHNAHNASASDGASNCHHFPGTFYDYHWPSMMARTEIANTDALDFNCSGPKELDTDDFRVPGDWREAQGSMWFHDHRFFFTAENVYKGHLGFLNQYSSRDAGNERLKDGVNLRLPSGWRKPWGNLDFDVNLVIADWAADQDGQYFFDIFNTDGFLGDNLHVNFAYKPFMEVLPRKYRLRTINCCMSRFLQLCFVNESGQRVRFKMIANDGNLLNTPLPGRLLDQQGTAERYDVIVDFSAFAPGEKIWLVNVLEHEDGRRPEDRIGHRRALNGRSDDPAVGAVMEFRVVTSVESVDEPGEFNSWTDNDKSRWGNNMQLTEQIEIVEPDRVRHVEWVRGGGDSDEALPGTLSGCIPDCLLDGEPRESFPWAVRVNGEEAHSLNANRISNLIPEPNTVEHWTYENGGGGWDHPIHLHFEEGVTMNRGDDSIPDSELLVRKDVWRLRTGGEVTFQVRFGEFGGAYVNHCHNTVHEDFAMLMRIDLLNNHDGVHGAVIDTPNPTPDGVEWHTPEILPEGDPTNLEFFFEAKLDAAKTAKA